MHSPYKKVQKVCRTLGLRDSLTHLWVYGLHVGYRYNLPFEYQHSRPTDQESRQLRKFVHEHQIDLYLKEVLMHAGPSSTARRSLKDWDTIGDLGNAIRDMGNASSGAREDIWLTLHRIGHQQAPNFDRVHAHYLGRYWSFYKRKPVSELLNRAFGMSVEDYFLLASAGFVNYLKSPENDLIANITALKLPSAALKERLGLLTISV